MVMKKLSEMNGANCPCGKNHEFKSEIITGSGVISKIPELVKSLGAKKPYILSDKNTYAAAADELCRLLDEAGIKYEAYSFPNEKLIPDEKAVGAAFMHMKSDCDIIIAVGSGVINDISKLLSLYTKLKFIILATAPSMDGYESMTSSMELSGVKTSLPSRCADYIIGDTDILKKAPNKMLLAGIGDMLAKYVSICEWRIASLLCDEYYCEDIAALVRLALDRILSSTEGLLNGDSDAVSSVFDGLSASSVAMNYAGISRPASGAEHYISHVFDMRGAEFGEPTDLHGIQCAIGTLISLRLYEKLKSIKPDREKALKYVKSFDLDLWNVELRDLLGKSAESLIALEAKEGKYDKAKHSARLELIIDKWDDILRIIDEELPSSENIFALLKKLGAPTSFTELGIDASLIPRAFCAAKDIRDKYVLPRLLWDLGLLDEFASDILA